MFPPIRPTLCSLVGYTFEISVISFVKRTASIISIVKMALNIKSVLILDGVSPKCGEILARHGISATYKNEITKNELLREIPKYEALVVCHKTMVSHDIIAAAFKLKIVAQAGVGVENIDCFAAALSGIRIINAPEAKTLSISEMTCSLIMNLSRCIMLADAALKIGRWEHELFCGTELNGKTLAILGLGRVGRDVATRMHAFGMKIIGFDPYMSEEHCALFHITKVELHEIWPLADYITLHETLSNTTEYYINENALRKCKQGVKIINVTNSKFIHAQSLLNALQSGKVGGIALDVYEKEPLTDPIMVQIIKHPCVIATPNLCGKTIEADIRIAQEIADQIVNLAKPETPNTRKTEVKDFWQRN